MDQKLIDALMDKYRQPAIMIHRPYPPITSSRFPSLPARSYLGGLPRLPAGAEWPRTSDDIPLHFLAQLDCAALPLNDALPKAGVLFFFARIDAYMKGWGSDNPHEYCRVLFFPDCGASATDAPDDLPAIQGEYSDWNKCFALPDEPPFNVYPSWPVTMHAVGSWPDPSAIRDELESDPQTYQGYNEAVWRARAAEVVRTIGTPIRPRERPYWGEYVWGAYPPYSTTSDGRYLQLPHKIFAQQLGYFSGPSGDFPHVWVMIDRISRHIACATRKRISIAEARAPKGMSDKADVERLRVDHQAALPWIVRAREAGLDEKVESATKQEFAAWLSAVSPMVAGGAVREGMESAIQYAGAHPKAAQHVPHDYFRSVEDKHLPFKVTPRRLSDGGPAWSIGAFCHQMLGNAPSSQEAKPFDRDDVLLLQLVSDRGIDFMFCDMGQAAFWINKRDLKARRFDRVYATTEGG